MGRTHHTPAWRSTSAGRWRGRQGWICPYKPGLCKDSLRHSDILARRQGCPDSSSCQAWFVGANTVKGPSAERASTSPAAETAARSVEKSELVETISGMDCSGAVFGFA